MVSLLQFIASSDATITWSLIIPRFKETYGSYIEYLPLPLVVTVLDLKGNQKSRAQPHVWCQYNKGLFGCVQINYIRVRGNLRI